MSSDPYTVSSRWPRHELFGALECPLLHRWTLIRLGDRWKLMLHWFVPGGRETDFHDHPRDFLTVALWGSYEDVRRDGRVDRVRAPTVRFRRATHAHVTAAGPRGCLTVAVFGRRRRAWGFWRAGMWWGWEQYERVFDSRFRCE